MGLFGGRKTGAWLVARLVVRRGYGAAQVTPRRTGSGIGNKHVDKICQAGWQGTYKFVLVLILAPHHGDTCEHKRQKLQMNHHWFSLYLLPVGLPIASRLIYESNQARQPWVTPHQGLSLFYGPFFPSAWTFAVNNQIPTSKNQTCWIQRTFYGYLCVSPCSG